MSAGEPEPGDLLAEGLATLGIDLDAEGRRRLLELATLLAGWAGRLNLTAHRTPAAIVRRLVLDAAALDRQLPAARRVADLGSGAGFPGLPLAVLRPSTRFVLVEARERRHHFQRTAIRQLGLSNAAARLGRIESLPLAPHRAEAASGAETLDGPAEGVVAQALARPPEALALALRWATPGGWIALPGSETAPAPGAVAGIGETEVRTYQVPCGGPRRTLWLGQRVGPR